MRAVLFPPAIEYRRKLASQSGRRPTIMFGPSANPNASIVEMISPVIVENRTFSGVGPNPSEASHRTRQGAVIEAGGAMRSQPRFWTKLWKPARIL
jgi:hypothetical protein